MGTTRSFQNMINDYLPESLLKEELIKRDYLLSKIEKDDGWVADGYSSGAAGETAYIVPFKAAGASSVAFGSLTADTDVAEDTFVRGRVTQQKEVWGTMIFNQRDLMEHGKVSEKNLLRLLPDSIEDFMQYMKQVVSMNLLSGEWITKLSSDGANGSIIVQHPDRFVLGQKISIDDDDSAPVTAYVTAIDINTSTLTIKDARSAGAAVNATAYTTAQNAKVYNDGQQSNGFSSLRAALLSSTNGGSSTLYGVTKASYPYTQSINVSGADITAVNIMEKIFDAMTTVRRLGKGAPTDIIMSYKHLASCMKVIEASKGSFNVTPGSQKASQFGWMEIEVGSVKGGLKLVGVQEMNDDVIYILDWRALKFASNGMFRKNKSPDGNEFYVKRATTGYQYILDVCLFGELIVHRPSYCGVLYSISY